MLWRVLGAWKCPVGNYVDYKSPLDCPSLTTLSFDYPTASYLQRVQIERIQYLNFMIVDMTGLTTLEVNLNLDGNSSKLVLKGRCSFLL